MIWAQKKDQNTLPNLELNGFRVVLRPMRLSDHAEWKRVRSTNQERLKEFEPKWAKDSFSKEFFERRYDRHTRDWASDRAYCFLIFDKNTHALIGGINLNSVCRGAAQNASLGYWIDEAYERQGFMSEAARIIIQYAFETLKLHRINAECLPDNERSINLLKTLGFTEEGFAKSYFQIKGIWQDHVLFGLVNPDQA
ncbi:MAG: GNAT family protein [Pseudomonadota bacterium]